MILYEGVAIIPAIGELCAPCDGEIIVLPESLHAVGIRTKNGAEILLHIGIDTVNMNGDGFTTTLKVGDKVSVGDLLVKVDLEKVKNAGYEATTPIVITNMEKVKILEKTESRNVTKGEKLVSYKCA